MTQAVSSSSFIRVALVTGGLKLGGTTTFLCNLSGELLRRGIPAEVFSFEKDNPLAGDFERARVPVFLQDETRGIFEDRLQAILCQLRRFGPSVVLANLGGQSFEVLRYLPKGVFRAGVTHTDHPREYALIKQYAATLDLSAGVSQTIYRKLQQLPELAGVTVKWLPLGVPMPQSDPNRDFRGPIRVLYLGRLSQDQKRVHLFPRIYADLKVSGIPFEWAMGGEGPDSAWLEKEFKNKGENIRFLGKIAYANVPKVLLSHDIFLLASDFEGLPLGLLEAMGAGMVPVVTDLASGITELVDEYTGRKVDVNDIAGYAKQIVWLHNNRPILKELSRNARAKVIEKFSASAMADRWLEAFPKTKTRIDWPKKWNIQPVMASTDRLRFSWPGRVARRLALRLLRK